MYGRRDHEMAYCSCAGERRAGARPLEGRRAPACSSAAGSATGAHGRRGTARSHACAWQGGSGLLPQRRAKGGAGLGPGSRASGGCSNGARGHGGRKRRRRCCPWNFLPEKRKKGRRINETSMDLRKRVYHSVENDYGYLLVVVAGVGTWRFGRKSSPNVRQKSSSEMRCKILAIDLRGLRVAAREK
jgi:hypothetical protein